MRDRLLSSLSLLALMPTAALAQTAPTPATGTTMLEPLVITGTRAPRPIDEVPQAVQVIEREAIEEQLKLSSNPSAAISKLIPGFSVSNQTISGASESFRGRDLLVMIDGVPLNTPLRDVSRMLALIDMNSVERIEVAAGASSLYGSGSTGGTVNFITKKAEPGPFNLSVETALRAFTHNPRSSLAPEMTATASGITEAVDYSVTMTGKFANKTYDGSGNELPSDGMLGQGGGDRYGQGSFSGKVGRDLTDEKRVELGATWVYLNQKPDWLTQYAPPRATPDFTSPYDGKSVKEDTKSVTARFQDTDFSLGALSLQGYYNDVYKRFNYSELSAYNNLVLYSGDPLNPTSPDNQSHLTSKRVGLNATIDTRLDALYSGLKLTWGADIGHEKTQQFYGDGSDAFTPLKQTNYAAFAQLQAPIGERVTVRGGVRYEYFDLGVSDFVRPSVYAIGLAPVPVVFAPVNVLGGDFSYGSPTFNLGGTVKLTDKSEVYGGFSQGYALSDIGAFTRRAGLTAALMGGGTVSYADIAPDTQKVNNYELGIRGGIGHSFRGSFGGFVSTSDSGVTFDPATNKLSQQKEIIYGLEATAEFDVTQALTIGAVASWREGKYDLDKDGDVDTYLPNNRIATPYRGLLYGTYRFDGGTVVRVEEEMWSGRNSFDGRAHNETKGGAITNLSLGHPLFGGQGFFSVNNLLDADYQVPTATATRNLPVNGWGRTITMGYQKQF